MCVHLWSVHTKLEPSGQSNAMGIQRPEFNPSFSPSQLCNLGKSDDLPVPQFLHPVKDYMKKETVFGQVNNSTKILLSIQVSTRNCARCWRVSKRQESIVTQLIVICYNYDKCCKGRVQVA